MSRRRDRLVAACIAVTLGALSCVDQPREDREDKAADRCHRSATACPPSGPACATHTPPSLGRPTLLVDGSPVANDRAPLGTRLTIAAAYFDPGCDFVCGEVGATWSGPDASGSVTVETRTDGGPRLDAGVVHIPLDVHWSRRPGDYVYVARATDGCGQPSNVLRGSFELIAREKSAAQPMGSSR